jgi:8-hydroxy-5-deazaflavin:NADPH oxidoreductase
MSVAIIGAGRLGSAIAGAFAEHDIPVLIANSRGPESLAELTNTLGPNVTAVSGTDALKADVVVLAAPWMALKDMLAGASQIRCMLRVDDEPSQAVARFIRRAVALEPPIAAMSAVLSDADTSEA